MNRRAEAVEAALLPPTGDQLRPHPALAAPVRDAGNGTDVPFTNGVASFECARKEKQHLLDGGSEVEEVHDLGDPG